MIQYGHYKVVHYSKDKEEYPWNWTFYLKGQNWDTLPLMADIKLLEFSFCKLSSIQFFSQVENMVYLWTRVQKLSWLQKKKLWWRRFFSSESNVTPVSNHIDKFETLWCPNSSEDRDGHWHVTRAWRRIGGMSCSRELFFTSGSRKEVDPVICSDTTLEGFELG